jgi:ABC-type Zn uptake system ZnuABC Zn-binding protein ZnuA
MKTNCDCCNGSGTVVCPECDGLGNYEEGIEDIMLDKKDPNYNELLELQLDARRVIAQAKILIEQKPSRKESYEAQLDATLKELNDQATKLQS